MTRASRRGRGQRSQPDREYSWTALRVVRASIKLAREIGASPVAAWRGGFGEAYIDADGDPELLGTRPRDGKPWRDVRHGFLKRHITQVEANGEELFNARDQPTKRLVALAVWAHVPSNVRLRYEQWLRDHGYLGRI